MRTGAGRSQLWREGGRAPAVQVPVSNLPAQVISPASLGRRAAQDGDAVLATGLLTKPH